MPRERDDPERRLQVRLVVEVEIRSKFDFWAATDAIYEAVRRRVRAGAGADGGDDRPQPVGMFEGEEKRLLLDVEASLLLW